MSPSPPYVQEIQQALGTGWEALLAQQYVIAGQQIIAGVVFAVLAFAAFRIAQSPQREWAEAKDTDDITGPVLACLGFYAGALLLGLPALGLLLDGFGHLLNPAGYAVQGIIDGLGGHAS